MAIYHLTAKTGSRSGGQSARAKADYIQREGKYARDMDEVLHAESGHMPEFVERPADYWDAADLYERANGRLFKEVEFALPVELTLDQQKALASEFAQHLTGAERLPYTLAIHAGGGENPPCHLMISERINDGIERPAAQWFKRYNGKTPEKSGAQKTEALKPKAWLEQTREAWADHANRALERAGHDARIDHRTLEAQGIERLPGVHLGPNVVEMEGRGIRTDRADVALNIDTANAQIIDLQEYREAIDHERNRQSEEIQRHQRVSGADRTAGPEHGDTGRRSPAGHEPDPAGQRGAGDQQQASRGSSVLVDNIRWQSYLSSMTSAEAEEWGVDDDQRRFFVRFGVSKANYGAPFADRWFRRHDGGVLKPAVLERQRKSKGVPRGEA